MNKNELIKELSEYDMTKKTEVSKQEYDARKDDPNIYVNELVAYSDGTVYHYIHELDDLTQTRILFKIFKCVNFIKNVIIVGIVLGFLGVVVAMMR